MNPFDTVNSDTNKNTSKSENSFKKDKPNKNDNKASKVIKKSNRFKKNITAKHHTKKSTKSKDSKHFAEIQQLKKQYSTVRLNMYDVLRLKIYQSIIHKNSRSDLIDDMIKVVNPVYINSSVRKKEYKELFKFAVKELNIKKKF